MAVNAEIDQAIRDSDLEVRRAASVALVKNIRAEGLLLEIEAEEAELTHRTAVTAMQQHLPGGRGARPVQGAARSA
jgi:hypothetical protein